MKKQTKPKHGGARKNAGRKPKYNEKTTTIAHRVPISLVDKINKMINDMVEEFLKNSNKPG